MRRHKTGVVQLLNLNNHDRISPLLKAFILSFVLLFIGTIFNRKLLVVGAGFVIFIYALIIAIWIKGRM